MRAAGSIRDGVARRLALAGCVAPIEEADELIEASDGDAGLLERRLERRTAGEPLAWIVGFSTFADQRVVVHEGVYVPRWQSEPLARRAVELLPDDGLAVDLCTGSGAVALVMSRARPRARVLATDIDALACRCAASNGVEVLCGDLAAPIPDEIRGRCHVVTAVAPYVPTDAIAYLPSDARDHEPLGALDGGTDGTAVLQRVVREGARLLRPGGTILLELGGDQDATLLEVLAASGFGTARGHEDEDGDLRYLEAQLR